MQPYLIVSILVLIMVIVVALIVIAASMKKANVKTDLANRERRPRGYWVGSGMSIGVGFGVALGLVMDNLALGIAMGAVIGLAFGAALEQRNKEVLRPLSEQEERLQRWGVAAGLLVLLILVGVFAYLFLSRMR